MKNYYKKRIKNLIKILLAPVSERTPETFHQLRVEIKKIRAFYTFVLFTHKKFPERKYMNPFKEPFKFAGKVRETYIFEKILKDLNLDKNKRLIIPLHKKRIKLINKFEGKIDKKLPTKIERRKYISEYLDDITQNDIEKYNKNKFEKSGKSLRDPLKKISYTKPGNN